MPYQYTPDIVNDVLFRAHEPTDGTSDYQGSVLDFVNTGYNAISTGTLEHTPDMHLPWWWLWSPMPGVITLQPNLGQRSTDGTVSCTQGSTAITFSNVPVDVTGVQVNLTGWYIRFTGSIQQSSSLDVFRILAHTPGQTSATLDSFYTGASNALCKFNTFNLEYSTPADLLYIVAPLRAYQTGREQVTVVGKYEMERFFPLTQVTFGIPNMACFIAEQKLRFSHYVGAGTTTSFARVDFDYIRIPPTLTGGANEEPLLPLKYRSILADYALQRLYFTKNDDRASPIGDVIKAKAQAIRREHVQRVAKDAGDNYGRVYPRQQDRASIRGPWRTESGFIIGY